MTTESAGLAPGEMTYPALFRAADRAARRGQRETLALTAVGLVVLLLSAFLGLLDLKVAGAIGAASFFAAVLIRSYSLTTRPERDWYDGRALAESAKTLSWRFAVGGNPFPLASTDSDELLGQRLLEILRDVNEVDLEPDAALADQITPEMRSARRLSLPQRRDIYQNLRVKDQFAWYSQRARMHMKRGRWLGLLTLAVECAGGAAGLAKVTGLVEVDLLAFFAAIAAAIIAWERTRQDTSLARAYSLAAQELGIIGSLISRQENEEDWARFVDHAEEAISREHTLWRASHT